MASTGIEVQITDASGENLDVSPRAPTRREGGVVWISKSHVYIFSLVIIILYGFTLGMSMFLYIRSTDQLTTLSSWAKVRLDSISNSLSQNSETLSRTSAAIIQNQYLIYESVNGTAINTLTQNQNLQNFIAAQTRIFQAIDAVLRGLAKG
jgi:hypothetical protein